VPRAARWSHLSSCSKQNNQQANPHQLSRKKLHVYIKDQYKCQQPENKGKHWHTGMKKPGREKARGKREMKKRAYSTTEYE